MRKFSVFSGSRSEYGLLKSLLKKLDTSKNVDLNLIISGSHFLKGYGNTFQEIKNDKIKISKKIYFKGIKMSHKNLSKNVLNLISDLSNYLASKRPDALILLGDRYETFAAACGVKVVGIPSSFESQFSNSCRFSSTKITTIVTILKFVITNIFVFNKKTSFIIIWNNVIADKCFVNWETRPVVKEDGIFLNNEIDKFTNEILLPEMQKIYPKSSIKKTIIGEITGFDRVPNSEACEFVSSITGDNSRDVVSFGTEAGLFQEIGISTVVCGPGSIKQAHKIDEFIKLSEIKKCISFLDGIKNKSLN